MRQFIARHSRYIELLNQRERTERLRFGILAAATMNSGMTKKEDGTAWVPWDFFEELQPLEEEVDEEENAQRILAMFKGIAAFQKVQGAN